MNLFQKIKQAFSSDPGNDSAPYPRGKCGYCGKTADFVKLYPYGLSANEPAGSFVLLINSQGQEAVKFGIPSAMKQRLKNLSQGEVALYNSETGVYVFLKADGTVEINADTLIDGDLHVTGDVQIDGNTAIGGTLDVTGLTTLTNVNITGVLNSSGSLSATGTSTMANATIGGISFGSHRHGGVQTNGGHTQGPE